MYTLPLIPLVVGALLVLLLVVNVLLRRLLVFFGFFLFLSHSKLFAD